MKAAPSFLLAFGVMAGLVAAQAAAAAPAPPPAQRARVLEDVAACRKVTTDAERLACYDRAVGQLDAAEAKGEVVVVDKAQVAEIRRNAFGFSLPSLSLLSRGKAAIDKEETESLETKIASSHQVANDRFVLTTVEGAVWAQTDGDLFTEPKAGQSLVVSHGMLGSFFCKVNGQPKVRCKRVN